MTPTSRSTAPASSSGPKEQVRGEVPDSETSVVEAYGVPVGRLRVVRNADVVKLAGLQLLPAHQSRGIGTRIIGDLVAEARASARLFELSVERTTCGRRRSTSGLGMVQVGETDHEVLMWLV